MIQAVAGNVNNFVIINLSELITKLVSYIATVSARINIIDVHIKLKSILKSITESSLTNINWFEGNFTKTKCQQNATHRGIMHIQLSHIFSL